MAVQWKSEIGFVVKLAVLCTFLTQCRAQNDNMLSQFVNELTDHGDRIASIEKLIPTFTANFDTMRKEINTLKLENGGLKQQIQVPFTWFNSIMLLKQVCQTVNKSVSKINITYHL